jgi:hypothetical protein
MSLNDAKVIAGRVAAGLNRMLFDPKLRELRALEREAIRSLLVDANAVANKLETMGAVDTFKGEPPPTRHPTAETVVARIASAILNGSGRFGFATLDGETALFAGAHRVVRVDNGFIVALGLTRAHLLEIRDAVNAALDASDAAGGAP